MVLIRCSTIRNTGQNVLIVGIYLEDYTLYLTLYFISILKSNFYYFYEFYGLAVSILFIVITFEPK